MKVQPKGLEQLKNKLVRYWLLNEKDAQCSFGWLIGWDNCGILLGDPGKSLKTASQLEGCQWYPWVLVYSISYFKSDAKET